MQVSDNLKQSYTNQYDASMIEWRRTAAKHKANHIIELTKDIQFKNVLEVGSGEGSILEWLSELNFCANLNCVEISESGIEIIKSKKIKNLNNIVLFDGYKLPYKDDEFDLIICSHVLEHVEFERTLLREIKRVSKHQVFEVPIDFSFYVDKKIKHYLNYGHINIYTPALFRFLLLSENFEIVKGKCYLEENDVLKMLYKNKMSKFYITKIKHLFLNIFPYFKGIKPNAFTVLTTKTDKNLKVF